MASRGTAAPVTRSSAKTALAPGTRLGVYEVIAQIGEGGMGAVYRATDTSLGRQVAIKVLPDTLAANARDGRFLINQPAGDATAAPITLLMNWKPEAKK